MWVIWSLYLYFISFIALIKHNRWLFLSVQREKTFTDISGLRTFRSLWGVPECPQGIFSKFFFHFYENDFSDFLHLIDLFNDYLCFYTYLKQLNFFADIPGRGHSGPLQTYTSHRDTHNLGILDRVDLDTDKPL